MSAARIPIDRATLRSAVRSVVASAMAEHRDAGRWEELAGRVARHDAFLSNVAFRGIAEDSAWVDGQLRKRQAWLANAARALGLSTEGGGAPLRPAQGAAVTAAIRLHEQGDAAMFAPPRSGCRNLPRSSRLRDALALRCAWRARPAASAP